MRSGATARTFAMFMVVILLSIPRVRAAGDERGRIQGRVADSSGYALPGAAVHGAPGDLTTRTDRRGAFTLGNLPDGAPKSGAAHIRLILSHSRDAQAS